MSGEISATDLKLARTSPYRLEPFYFLFHLRIVVPFLLRQSRRSADQEGLICGGMKDADGEGLLPYVRSTWLQMRRPA
jgi:hypothetical protein